jgi:energy-coupling factor transporter ATP-binding protein EcfA2
MYRDNYITALRQEMLELVQDRLSPVARRYGYSQTPLEANIKWRPQVLFLGNYSSGKSTLINELLGVPILATGQAPTDDCFTVITYVAAEGAAEIRAALNELAGMRPEGPSLIPLPSSEGGSVLPLKKASPDKD